MRVARAFAPALGWALLVWLIGGAESLPSDRLPQTRGLDKVAHFAMYGVLGWLAGRGWVVSGLRRGRMTIVLAVVMLGAADELRQARLPGRSAEFADWLADAAGAATGYVLGLRRRRSQSESEPKHE
jgi:VanZ family protein